MSMMFPALILIVLLSGMKDFLLKVVMNVKALSDDNGNTKFNGYLKNAQIDWRGYGFFASVGLINLKQFSSWYKILQVADLL